MGVSSQRLQAGRDGAGRDGGPTMARQPKITRVEVFQYAYDVKDMGTDYNGFNSVYLAGSTAKNTGHLIKIDTDAGVSGEYAGGTSSTYAQVARVAKYLIGRNPLQRELI